MKKYKVEDLDYEKAVEASENNRYAMIIAAAAEHRRLNRKKISGQRISSLEPLFALVESGKKK